MWGGGILETFADGLWHFESLVLGWSKRKWSAGVWYSTRASDHVLGEMVVLESESTVMTHRTRTRCLRWAGLAHDHVGRGMLVLGVGTWAGGRGGGGMMRMARNGGLKRVLR